MSVTAEFGVTPAQAAEPSKQMEEFLSFDRKNQDGFISNSMMMLGVIAAQTEPKIAQCLNKWYQDSDTVKTKRHDEILDAMQDLPQYVPTTIVLAVAERACGKFKRVN